MYTAKVTVLKNYDLLRFIGEFIAGSQLAFILSFKDVREALRPLTTKSGEVWITSKKKYFVTSTSMAIWAQSLGSFNGSLNLLRTLHRQYPPDRYKAGVRYDVCCQAAKNGDLAMLEYLRTLGKIVGWNDLVCTDAAMSGHLNVVKWLREVLDPPCPWDHYTCTFTALAGHLHILYWLRDQNPPCPWSKFTCHSAVLKGNLEILKWLRSQDPPCPWNRQECIAKARENNHHEVVEWILSQPE